MGLFSEMLGEERIDRSLANSRVILIITCPGCACESLSYSYNLPNRSLKEGKDMEHSALAVHLIRDRWDERLRLSAKEVKHITISFPCEMYDSDCDRIISALDGVDTVAVLSCSSGFIGIRDLLLVNRPNMLVVPMMKTSGTFVFRLVTDEDGENCKVDHTSARIVRFREMFGATKK